jgi:hypothetical protein
VLQTYTNSLLAQGLTNTWQNGCCWAGDLTGVTSIQDFSYYLQVIPSSATSAPTTIAANIWEVSSFT